MFKRLASLVLIAAALLSSSGCARRIPSTTDEFSAAKRMVLTFRDGETLSGRFAVGQDVRYVTFGKIYRGTIEDLGPPDIILTNVYVEEEYDRREVQRSRLETSDLQVSDAATRLLIPRHKLVLVEEVGINREKTTRGFFFWTFTGIMLGTIVSSRF